MRARGPFVLAAVLCLSAACSDLKVADSGGDGGGPGGNDAAAQSDADVSNDASTMPGKDSGTDAKAPVTIKVPVIVSAVIAGSISIAVDDTGEAALAWLDTPSAQRHLHIARIAGGEEPPRVEVLSDTPLESNASSLGQAVAAFTPTKGCFGVLWGQAGALNVAAVGSDAKPGASSVFATISAGAVARLSQVRAAPDDAGGALVAWSELARYGGDASGVFHTGALPFTGCAAGTPSLDADALSTGTLAYQAPPAGAPELALTRTGGVFHAALQQTVSGTILGVAHRARAAATFDAAGSVDDGGTVTAGGSVGIAGNGANLAIAYYRRTTDTLADLVVATVTPAGVKTGETVLEHDVLAGVASNTYLEAARLAVASRTGGSAVIAAVFARDAMTSELRVYRADAKAPGGFRSELVDTNVFGPRGTGDAHPLLDAAVDASGRIHVAWRSGVSKAITYARLPP